MIGLGLVGLMGLWQNSSHTTRHINTPPPPPFSYRPFPSLIPLIGLPLAGSFWDIFPPSIGSPPPPLLNSYIEIGLLGGVRTV